MEVRSLLALSVVIALGIWKLACISMRRRRAKLLASMDPVKDAHKLLWFMYSVEFPFLTQLALEFGTLKTLGIPSITKLLNKSKYGLVEPSKRAAETNILVSEFLHHHVDSDRGSYALQRLNAVHAQFKISNKDFVYVLCLNVLNPIDFAQRFGYREWSDKEQLAAYTVWHDVGVRMGIKDIPASIAEMRRYAADFEAKYAVYDEVNRKTVQGLKHLVLDAFPWFLRPLGEPGVCSLLDDRLIVATGLPKQPFLLKCLLLSLLSLLKLLSGSIVAALMLPRPLSMAKNSIQVDWSENPAALPDKVRQLNHNMYKAFHSGYQLSRLGAAKPGKLVPPRDGALLCPFRM